MKISTENNLKALVISNLDFMLLAWAFFVTYLIVSYISRAISFAIDFEVLATLLSVFVMQLAFLSFSLIANKIFSFKLLEFNLTLKKLIFLSFKFFAFSILLILPLNVLVNLIFMLLGVDLNMQDSIQLWLSTSGILEKSLGLFCIVILAPIAEELLFRGLLYRLLKTKMYYVFAMILSSVIFALIHFSLASFVSLFAFAFLLCALYEKYKDIRLNIFIHALFNLFNSLILILWQSGQNL